MDVRHMDQYVENGSRRGEQTIYFSVNERHRGPCKRSLYLDLWNRFCLQHTATESEDVQIRPNAFASCASKSLTRVSDGVYVPNFDDVEKVFDYGVSWDEVKDAALPLLQKFTAHTNGSNIKLRDAGVAWSYYSTDPEWGQMQAKQLHAELEVIAHVRR